MTSLRQRAPRERDERYLSFVRTLACCVCRAPAPSEAAHVRMACLEHGKEYTGKGEKPSDRYCTPLCRDCHARQHSMSEEAFWIMVGKDPLAIAARLYALGGGTATTKKPKARARFVGSAKIQNGKTVWAKRPFPSSRPFPKRQIQDAAE